MYEAEDKMISIIRDNYEILQSLGSFGINLGFGDKTIKEVCENEGVEVYTFLAIINFTINGYLDKENTEKLSIPTLLHYLKASHEYYLNYQIPFIRKELEGALDKNDNLAHLILRSYYEYARCVSNHMNYEEKTVFPYVDKLLNKQPTNNYNIDTFSKHHTQIDKQLKEIKEIIIRYLPSDGLHNNQLTATLYDIHSCEVWLDQHSSVEEEIFIPAIKRLEMEMSQRDVTAKISNMINKTTTTADTLSDREKDVLICVVEGMINKEIAEHLFISINTVITHRRNIAKKLQIHSVAGLTIYAIVNKLVDISNVKL